jgi:hypothetical protein
MFGKLRTATQVVKDKVGDALGMGWDKVKAQLDDLAQASGALEQVGYKIGDIDLEFTVPPRVHIHLTREAAVHDEVFQAVLANNAGNRTFCLVVGLLRQTNRLLDKVTIKGRRLREVEVGLGLIPSVKLKYAGPDSPTPPG